MGRYKMFGGFERSTWIFIIIGVVVIAIIALGLGLGLGLKPKSSASSPDAPPGTYLDGLSISVSGTPYGCKQNQVGCTPTGANLVVTIGDTSYARGANVIWNATGFDETGKVIKGSGSVPVPASGSIVRISSNLAKSLSKIQYSVYLQKGGYVGNQAYYNFS